MGSAIESGCGASNHSTIGSFLRRAAHQHPRNGIAYVKGEEPKYTFRSYPEILDQAWRIATGLRAYGMATGTPVVLLIESLEWMVTSIWACALGGGVAVPIASDCERGLAGRPLRRLQSAVARVAPAIAVAEKRALPEATLHCSNGNGPIVAIVAVEELLATAPAKEGCWGHPDPDSPVVLIETSGSTGSPKYVTLTHRNISSNVSSSARANSLSSECVELNSFPLEHVGSLVRCMIRPTFVGSNQVHIEPQLALKEPETWIRIASECRATHVWAPCFFLHMLSKMENRVLRSRPDLGCIRSLLTVSEPIDGRVASKAYRCLAALGLSCSAMHAAWGMSETGSAVVFSHDYLARLHDKPDGSLVEVGVPVRGLSIRIVDQEGRPIRDGIEGHLQVHGPMVTPGYYGDDHQTNQVFTKDGWLRTGDFASIRKGRLTITGRASDRLSVHGRVLHRGVIEASINAVDGVQEGSAIVLTHRVSGDVADRMSAVFTPEPGPRALRSVVLDIRRNVLLGTGAALQQVFPLEQEQIPRSSVGKPQRDALLRMLQSSTLKARSGPSQESPSHRSSRDRLCRVCWIPAAEGEPSLPSLQGVYVVFLESGECGNSILSTLREAGCKCIRVSAGPSFMRVNKNHYRIHTEQSEDYRKLYTAIRQESGIITHVMDLRACRPVRALSANAIHEEANRVLRHITHVVAGLKETRVLGPSIRLIVVSSGGTVVTAGKRISPARAGIGAYVQSIAREYGWLEARHVDLVFRTDRELEELALRELLRGGGEPQAAIASAKRHVPVLQPLPRNRDSDADGISLGHGEGYVITGGLGAIGFELARHIMLHGSRVLLIGRTSLDFGPEGPSEVDMLSDVRHKWQRLQELKHLGEVLYMALDACSPDVLELAVAEAEKHWGRRMTGVFHLSRVASHRHVGENTKESLDAVLAPKILGTAAVAELLIRRPDSFGVVFSSATALYGSYLMGAYAAASSIQEAYCWTLRANHGVDLRCWSWSMWDCDDSRERHYQMRDLAQAKGFDVLSPAQGLACIDAAFGHDQMDMYIGYCPIDAHQEVNARAFARREETLSERAPCCTPHAQAAETSARIDTEAIVLHVLRTVLDLDEIDQDDSFIDLGGDSLTVLQTVHALETALNCTLTPDAVLFQSVRQLVTALRQKLEHPTSGE